MVEDFAMAFSIISAETWDTILPILKIILGL